jgi:hypothetical protein
MRGYVLSFLPVSMGFYFIDAEADIFV